MEHLPAADGSANAIQQTRYPLKELNRGPHEAQELWAGSTQRPEKHTEISSHQRIQEPTFPFVGKKLPTQDQNPRDILLSVCLCACVRCRTHTPLETRPIMLQADRTMKQRLCVCLAAGHGSAQLLYLPSLQPPQ